jgi:transposase
VSKAGKYKSTKITALCNEQGQIQQIELGNGGESDHKAVLRIIPYIPKRVYVTLDRGYDSKKLRRKIRHHKTFPICPRRQQGIKIVRRTPKPFIYKLRWIIEQAFSKTDQFRKLLVRQERNPFNYKQYWYLGLAIFEIQKLTG